MNPSENVCHGRARVVRDAICACGSRNLLSGLLVYRAAPSDAPFSGGGKSYEEIDDGGDAEKAPLTIRTQAAGAKRRLRPLSRHFSTHAFGTDLLRNLGQGRRQSLSLSRILRMLMSPARRNRRRERRTGKGRLSDREWWCGVCNEAKSSR